MANERKRVPNSERKRISMERLKELIHYSPDTGSFTRVSAARAQMSHLIGKSAGYIKPGGNADGGGYLMLYIDGRVYRGHHVAWFWMTGEWPTLDIDHINDIRHDNSWSNLRAATRSQNIGNARMPHDSWSGVKGATWDRARRQWRAQITFNGKNIHLGRYPTKEAAGAAYEAASRKYFGEFARVSA